MIVRRALTAIVLVVAATAHADGGARDGGAGDGGARAGRGGGTWRAWNRPKFIRARATLTVLADGRVLLTGGRESAPDPPVPALEHSAEVLDPRTGIWSLTDPMPGHPAGYAIAALPSGGVLLAAGHDHTKVERPRRSRWATYEGPPPISASMLSSAQLWDPVRGWRVVGAMAEKRTGARAAALPDGRVLVMGGLQTTYGPSYIHPSILTFGNLRFLASAEVWSPDTGRWRQVAPMSQPRVVHTATTLADGRVLVVGGMPGEMAPVPTAAPAEIWTPATGAWTPIARPRQERTRHAAIRLVDGRVLITGGTLLREFYGQEQKALASAEAWDPRTTRWTDVSPMHFARSDHDAVLLADGRVLVAGIVPMWGEIRDPATDSWTSTPPLTEQLRGDFYLAALRDGRVVAVATTGVQLWTP